MHRFLIISCMTIAISTAVVESGAGSCRGDCEKAYQSELQDCQSRYGDPEDADDLTTCIGGARDDYRSCINDCLSRGE